MFIPHLTRWLKLPGLARSAEPVWVTPRGVRPDFPGLRRMLPEIGYYLVHDWVGVPHLFEGVEAMFRFVGGEVVSHPVTVEDRTDPIITAFRDERLWLWRVPVLGVPEPAVFPEKPRSTPPPPDQPTEVLTWIEISVEDERGEVVVDEPVLIVDADGRPHERRTNLEGVVRLEPLSPGTCAVSFPRIDGREWKSKGGAFPSGNDIVARVHEVHARECMARIAFRYTFRSRDTLWLHDCNAPLRDTGRDPDVLWPGDRVKILARDDRGEDADTGRRHPFVVRTAERWLRLVLHDVFRRPLVSVPYVLELRGGPTLSDTTGEDGSMQEIIPPWVTEGVLTAGNLVWPIAIADLRPVKNAPDGGDEGVLRRLRNLGCPAGRDAVARPSTESRTDGDESAQDQESANRFDADVFMHQVAMDWRPSGELDDETRARVIDEFGV